MKQLIILIVLTFSVPLMAADHESELNLIKVNESAFSEKEILMKPELCQFHRELLIKVGRPAIECPRNEGSTTKDDEVVKQLKEVNELVAMPEQSTLGGAIINMPQRGR